jgi:hypothetical protein
MSASARRPEVEVQILDSCPQPAAGRARRLLRWRADELLVRALVHQRHPVLPAGVRPSTGRGLEVLLLVLFVGDDGAEAHHDIIIQEGTGRRLVRRRLPEDRAGIAPLQ